MPRQLVMLLMLASVTLAALLTKSDAPAASIDYFKTYLTQSRIPGVVCIYNQGKSGPYTISEGLSDIENKKPAELTQLFDSGSIGKMFTTIVTLRLAEDKKLNLNDKLEKYVNQIPESWKSATISQMLSHTSGLPEYVLYDGIQLTQDFELPKYFEIMADKPVDFAPGTEFQYSNSNFFMLKLVAEKASGKPFKDLLKSYVFDPSGMTETGTLLTEEILTKRKAVGYWVAQEIQPIGPAGKSPDIGSGGHFTTVADLTKFAHSLFGGKLLNKDSFTKMTTPAPLPEGRKAPYGYGLFIRNVNRTTIWSHGGNSVGYAGSVTYIPSKDTTIVLLGNAYQMSGDSVALGLARVLYPELNPKPLTEQTDPNPDLSKTLVEVLNSLAAQKLDHEMLNAEIKSRLARPRGQMQLQGMAPAADCEFDAYMGSEKVEPDTLVRIRVKKGEQKWIATFTIDAEGKVHSVGLAPTR